MIIGMNSNAYQYSCATTDTFDIDTSIQDNCGSEAYYRSFQRDIQVFACEDCFRARYQYDRLCVVNDHGRALQGVTCLQGRQQKDRRVVDTTDSVKVHAVRCVCFCPVNRTRVELLDFCKHGLAEFVEGLAYAAHLPVLVSNQRSGYHEDMP